VLKKLIEKIGEIPMKKRTVMMIVWLFYQAREYISRILRFFIKMGMQLAHP